MESEFPIIKAFISYAWSSDSHEAWVLDLASRLTADGVTVILDKWDLKVGHDANAFMEQMVTDQSVTKVLMICDKVYKEKADGRMGGVGKETTILTADIYDRTEQDKYAALLTEYDNNGKGFVPAFYGGRQYIDFADDRRIEESYQELLRWIYGKPKFVRPKLGRAPSFITQPDALVTSTTSKFKAAEYAIHKNERQAAGYIVDFGEAMVAEFRSLRAVRSDTEPFDEVVLKSAEAMRPALRHLFDLALTEARFSGSNVMGLIRILELLGSLMYRPLDVNRGHEEDYDAYKIIIHESFIGMIAIFLLEKRFDLLASVVSHPFYIPERVREGGAATASYRIFCPDVSSLRSRNARLNLNRVDPHADLLNEVYSIGFPKMEILIEADLLLFLRGMMAKDSSGYENWWPRTLIYAQRHTAVEIFARSESLSFFNKWSSQILGGITVDEFKSSVMQMKDVFRRDFGGFGPSLAILTNYENIGSKP